MNDYLAKEISGYMKSIIETLFLGLIIELLIFHSLGVPRRMVFIEDGLMIGGTFFGILLNTILFLIIIGIRKRWKISKDKKLLCYVLLFVFMHCFVDILEQLFVASNTLVFGIMFMAKWFIITMIIRRVCGEENSEKQWVKNVLFVIMTIFVVVISLYIDSTLDNARLVFNSQSKILDNILRNQEFIYSIVISFADLIMLLVACAPYNIDDDERAGVRVFSRIMIVLVFSVIISIVKQMVYPPLTLVEGEISSMEFFPSDNKVFINDATRYIYRLDSHGNKEYVYASGKYKVMRNDTAIKEEAFFPGDKYKSYRVEYEGFVLRDNEIILIEEQGEEVVFLSNLDTMGFNKRLVECLEVIISDGNLDVYVKSINYMVEHDREFILEYVKRYANNDFSSRELPEENNSYNIDYVVQISSAAIMQI